MTGFLSSVNFKVIFSSVLGAPDCFCTKRLYNSNPFWSGLAKSGVMYSRVTVLVSPGGRLSQLAKTVLPDSLYIKVFVTASTLVPESISERSESCLAPEKIGRAHV